VGTRRLTLLRHGKAQSIDSCAEDFERALTRRGCVEAQEMAMRIVYRDLVPAEIVAQVCELDSRQVQCARELYLGSPETTWRLLAGRDAALGHIMICGHNPGLSQIASRLGPKPQLRELQTAGIASALWYDARWDTLQPESADSCELDDPESMADLWA